MENPYNPNDIQDLSGVSGWINRSPRSIHTKINQNALNSGKDLRTKKEIMAGRVENRVGNTASDRQGEYWERLRTGKPVNTGKANLSEVIKERRLMKDPELWEEWADQPLSKFEPITEIAKRRGISAEDPSMIRRATEDIKNALYPQPTQAERFRVERPRVKIW